MDIIQALKEELQIGRNQVEAAVKLIDEGNTIPFIARYRKEATGSLNDEVLRQLDERLRYLRNLEDKKEQVIGAIRAQEKLTPALEKQIRDAATLVAVEDLYLPYRPKRRTRAGIAREKGLEPLAVWIYKQEAGGSLEAEAAKYVSEEKGVADVSEAIDGARDILAEQISEMAKYRNYARKKTMQDGLLEASAKDEKIQSVYEMYYHFSEPVKKLAGHRVLAINRGEKEKILSVKLIAPEEQIVRYMEKQLIIRPDGDAARVMEEVILDSYRRLIGPAIEREIRAGLTETAENGAIQVFGKNLEQLLMQPPIAGCVVLGWDPAFRTGCKLAVVDETGKVLDTTVIYPTAPQNRVEESKEIVKKLIRKYGISLISVGNGTASRESEQIIVELLKEIPEKVQYVIVNEAGASVYSASKLAAEEFPDFELYMEQLVSLGNRYLACFSETPLTSSMINSYVKKGLMSRPEKKRYRAEHIAELIVISLLKTTYPLETIRNCIERVICDEESVQIAYDNFSDRFNQTLHALYSGNDSISIKTPTTKLECVSISEELAVRAVIYRLVSQKIMSSKTE